MLTLILLANTDPTIPPQPGLRPGLTEDQITPGLLGFVVTFSIVVIMVFLIRDMVKRIRRVRYRAQVAGEDVDGGATEHMGIPIMMGDAGTTVPVSTPDVSLAKDAPGGDTPPTETK